MATHAAQVLPIRAAPTLSFSALQFINGEDGWLGADGELGVTTNGGQSWTWHALPGVTVNSISFANATSGWLVGSTDACSHSSGCQSVVMHSADGGATWQRQLAAPCGTTCSGGTVKAVDATHAWAFVGCPRGPTFDPCVKLMTTDRDGQHWRPVSLPSSFWASAMAFVSAGEGWVAGCTTPPQNIGYCTTELLHTTDGGASWVKERLPASITGGAALSFVNASDGWLMPGGPPFAMGGGWHALYATTDGGQSWSLVKSSYRRLGFPGGPTFVNATVGYVAVGAGAGGGVGAIVRTVDGGRTWTSSGDGKGWSMSVLSAVGTQDVWAVGQQKLGSPDFLVRSTDGGRTWTQLLPVPTPTAAVDFISPDVGFGVGMASDPGAVLTTDDGGLHWRLLAGQSPTPAALNSVVFVDARDGWAAGTTGAPGSGGHPLLLATRDGGKAWTVIDHPSKPVLGFGFVNDEQGWLAAAGAPPTLQTTSDGGHSWRQGPALPPGDVPVRVAFLTLDDGWSMRFAGHHAHQPDILSRTTDGGKVWVDLSVIPGSAGPFALAPTAPEDMWLAETGALLHTTNGGGAWTKWSLGQLPGPESPETLDFADPQDGWLLTSQYGDTALWRTIDGGHTWMQLW